MSRQRALKATLIALALAIGAANAQAQPVPGQGRYFMCVNQCLAEMLRCVSGRITVADARRGAARDALRADFTAATINRARCDALANGEEAHDECARQFQDAVLAANVRYLLTLGWIQNRLQSDISACQVGEAVCVATRCANLT